MPSRRYRSGTSSMCGVKKSRWCDGCARSRLPTGMSANLCNVWGRGGRTWFADGGAHERSQLTSHREKGRSPVPIAASPQEPVTYYFLPVLPAFTFAHRARCAAAILLRPAAEIVRFCVEVAAALGLTPCM